MTPLRLVIFEDNNDFRESLLHLFRFTPDVEVVAAYPDCSGVRNAVTQWKPEVVLMDIDMPGLNGIEATAAVKEASPTTQVVMLTVSEEEDRIFQALRNGATGYLLKKSGPDELVESVRLVHKGGSPMSPAIARKVLQFFHLTQAIPQTPAAVQKAVEIDDEALATGLTPREQEILEALVDGLSYKMIAAKHFISTDTVKNHIQGIYRKLHVNSKGEAISYALKRGLAGNR
ncbi:MAG TPA: DNA-binding response regulator [Saprospirales bacterium]|nr:DNA-binding response regulator [Saprospirales bacterium]